MHADQLTNDRDPPRRYGACDEEGTLRSSSSLPLYNEACESGEVTSVGVRSNDDEVDSIEPSVVSTLEDIFARANEGMPLYHRLGGILGVSSKLRTDLQKGVTPTSVKARREGFGANTLPGEPPLTFWRIYLAAWSDNMIRLLAVAAVVSLVLGLTVPEPGETKVDYDTAWIEGFSILCSVLIVTTVSSVNDYQKEKKFKKLTDENAQQPIRVMRGGVVETIDVSEIVVGDVVELSPGLVVPVDGFYVTGRSVVIDESSVTGENDPKAKTPASPIILSGTVVNTAEEAYMLACAVGERSFGGKLLMESYQGAEGPQLTPLQQRLDTLAGYVGRVGLIVAGALFVILCVMEIVRLARHSSDSSPKHFVDYVLICVALVVVAVPEGLPLAVTIALASSQNRMQDDNNQVRRLCACETMGNATQICSDKTGTLTQNNMSVVQGYTGMMYFSVPRPGDLPEPIHLGTIPESTKKCLTEALSANSSSEKVRAIEEERGWKWLLDKGNKTDNALLDFVDRLLMNGESEEVPSVLPHQRLRQQVRSDDFTIFPFTSDRKRMSTVVRQPDGSLMHFVKGGSDQVLTLCDRYLDESGVEQPLTEDIEKQIRVQIRQLATAANRTIGVAFARLPKTTKMSEEEPTERLVWLALLGVQDPLRAEVPEAVRKCQMAGVMVRMCTGDNVDTAVAIARQCGIFNRARGDLALTGREFRDLVYDTYGNEARMPRFWSVLEHMAVMARSQPLDKQLLVLMLMIRGDVVAVTGDGTNDAPALRLANVGFVMRSGTDVAVKSADIVLLDDNFHSVQRALVWGRCVNDNIRKFLQLQLTVNYVSVVLTFVGCVVARGHSSPLSTVQLLWLNLIMDTLAALALATEKPSEKCLHRPPISRQEPLISYRMHLTILVATVYILFISLCVEHFPESWLHLGSRGSRENQTFVFNIIVLCTIGHMVSCRKLYDEVNIFEGFKRSKPFIIVVCVCVGFQVLAVETFGAFMQTTHLSLYEWLLCLALAFLLIGVTTLSRLIVLPTPVYTKNFDSSLLDYDAKRSLEKLGTVVEKAREDESYNSGKCLDDVFRLRAKALWGKVQQHHIKGNKVIKMIRGSYLNRMNAERGLL